MRRYLPFLYVFLDIINPAFLIRISNQYFKSVLINDDDYRMTKMTNDEYLCRCRREPRRYLDTPTLRGSQDEDAVAFPFQYSKPISSFNFQVLSFPSGLVIASATISAVGQYSRRIDPFSTHSRIK